LYQLLKSICDVNERQCFKQEQELISIADNLEHITFIVGKQQSSRSGGNQNEVVDPQSLMLQAIAINTGENSAVDPIVDLQFSDVPEVETSKHEVLQVLVNLIKNSKQAVRHLDIDKQSVTAIIEADESWLRFRVADNGIGVSRQNMRKLFSHGFTTKETGHGFGLSASIETARKLGGDLTCRSDGEGMGATFELKLPVAADDRMSQSIVEDACHV
jgi:C4-dicarboxylate-specific signal transduction histidine kinase